MRVRCKNRQIQFELEFTSACTETFPSIRKLKHGSDNRTSDLASKLNAMWAMLERDKVETYGEPMAGIGFTPMLLQTWKKPWRMTLNDLSFDNADCLQRSFPNVQVSHQDAYKGKFIDRFPNCDCIFLDRCHTTLSRDSSFISDIRPYLLKTIHIFLYTDVYPYYVFLKYQGDEAQQKMDEYIVRSNEFFRESGWEIRKVFLYPSRRVAVVKARRTQNKQWSYVTCSDPFVVKFVEGLDLL